MFDSPYHSPERRLLRYIGGGLASVAALWLWHCLNPEGEPRWVAAIAGVGVIFCVYWLLLRLVKAVKEKI